MYTPRAERVLLNLGNRKFEDAPFAKEVSARCRFGPEWGAGDWALFKRLPQPD